MHRTARISRLPMSVLLILSACRNETAGPPDGPPTPTLLNVAPAADTIDAVGFTTQFTATVLDQFGDLLVSAPVSWSTMNVAVVEIGASSGRATARGAGTTQIIATAGAVQGSASVTVRPPANVIITGASQRSTNVGEFTVTAGLQNTGGRGFYLIEFWALRNSPTASNRLLGTSETIEVAPGYRETLSWRVPVSSTLGVSWIIAHTRDPNSGSYRETSRFDFLTQYRE